MSQSHIEVIAMDVLSLLGLLQRLSPSNSAEVYEAIADCMDEDPQAMRLVTRAATQLQLCVIQVDRRRSESKATDTRITAASARALRKECYTLDEVLSLVERAAKDNPVMSITKAKLSPGVINKLEERGFTFKETPDECRYCYLCWAEV